MSKRMVSTSFWDDPYIASLDPSEKLLFLYFLTNPRTNISGCYEITLRRIAFDTGLHSDMVEKLLSRFYADGKIIYRNGWLAIKNFQKHQSKSPKIQAGILKCMENVPKSIQQWVSDTVSIESDTVTIESPVLESNYNNNYNPESKQKAPKEKPSPDVQTLNQHYLDAVKKACGEYPANAGRSGKVFKELLLLHPQATIMAKLNTWLKDKWVIDNGFPIGAFLNSFHKIKTQEKTWDNLPDYTNGMPDQGGIHK